MQKLFTSLAGLVAIGAWSSVRTIDQPVPRPAKDNPLIGVTVPSKIAAVAPEQAGKIAAVPVSEGDRVTPETVLFRLSSRLEELEVVRLRDLADSDLSRKRAAVSLRHAEQEERRVRDLCDQKIASDRDLQAQIHEVELARVRLLQAHLEHAQAANELAQAVERLEQRTVRSPFAGIVTQRLRSEGEAVERFVPVVEVMSLDPLWVEFDCPVAEERSFEVGGEIVVAPAVRQDDVRSAKILFVSMKATASSHTFMVRAAVANPDLRWKAGLKMVINPSPAAQPPSRPGK
jgi:RND family efflux transporter MFP subunit